MRLSRHCYDKAHRCPGWAGGGFRFAKVNRCDGGRIVMDYDNRWRKWRFNRCNKCDVVCWPIVVRELDWRWWTWRARKWGWKLQEKLLWRAQYIIVAGLETICGWIDKIPVLQRDDAGKWALVGSCWGCYPLRLATLSDKLDRRWKTGAWTDIAPEERQDDDHEIF